MRPGYPPALPLNAAPSDGGELNLAKYLSILRKNLWVIAGIVMCSTLVAALVSLRSPKIYEAFARIDVERETPNITDFKQVVGDSFDYEMFIETQQRIIQSNTLAWKTIQDLQLYSNEGFVGKQSGARRDPSRPWSEREQYSLTMRFLGNTRVVRVRGSQILEIHFMCFDPSVAAEVANKLSENYMRHNIKAKYDATVQATDWLQGELDDLKRKVEKSEEEMVAYERANSILLLDEKSDHSVAQDKLGDVSKALTQAESERKAAEARWNVQKELGPEAIASGSGALGGLQARLSELNQQVAEYSQNYGVNHPKYAIIKAKRDQLQLEIDKETKRLVSQFEADYRVATDKEASIRKLFNDVKGQVENQNDKSIQYNLLKREVESNRNIYNGLQQKLKEAQVTTGMASNNIEMVDMAFSPLAPTLPRTGQNISLGVIVGFLLGLAASFIRDFLDNTIKTPDDVEQYAGLPNLGVIPGISPGLVRAAYYAGYGLGKSKHKELEAGEEEEISTEATESKALVGMCRPETVTLTHPHSSISESFRALRTALLLANSGMPPRTILVTSGLPSEGKTTIAINVAITLAQRGGRVLLIDADLRRPSVHRHLSLSKKGREDMPGLSHYLTGNAALADTIVPSGLVPNLDLMLAGSIPPNPAELCSSETMRKLLHELREEYTHVVLDSPPLLSVTDSTILSVQTDGVLLVSRSGFSTRDSLRRAKKLLEHVNARLLGVVLNDLNLAVDGYYYYYYYGYYGYGRPDREARNAVGS